MYFEVTTFLSRATIIVVFIYHVISLRCFYCQQNPSIVHITPGQTVNLGDTIDLSCSVQYGANYPIIWTKLSDNPNNPPLFISKDATLSVYDNRYSIRHDESSSTYTLQVSKIQDTDTGTYQCQVVTSSTNRITADTFISVRIPPLILDSASSRGLVVRSGETFSLHCSATGVPKPKISWRRENNGLLPTGGTVAKGQSITIYNATKDDRGIYYCLADNNVGRAAKRSIGVEIEFAPQVGLIRSRYQQALGYPAELHCSIEASPMADISWLKDGYELASANSANQLAADQYYISSSSNSHDFIQSTLRIRRVEQRDFGTYRCRAINKLGDRSNSMLLERSYSGPVCPPACNEGEYQSITSSAARSIHQINLLATSSGHRLLALLFWSMVTLLLVPMMIGTRQTTTTST